MGWSLEGKTVRGRYLETFPVCGIVEYSRVKYGGKVSHTILLETPINVFGAIRERVTLDEDAITKIEE